MKYIKPRFLTLLILAVSLFAVVSTPHKAVAACTPSGDYGSVSQTISAPATGSYRVWSRILTPTPANNSYMLEVDGSCYTVGGANLTANSWTWVDYQNGNSSSKINITLASGNHSVKMYGNAPNVELDRVLFLADTSCPPRDTGDNCVVETPTPVPTATPTATPAPTVAPTATPTPVASCAVKGDVNCDNHVTSLDLAVLLSNWNKQSGATHAQGDLSGDGKVTSLDLATLLSNWGK